MAAVDKFFIEGQAAFYKSRRYGRFTHHVCNPYTHNTFRGKEWLRGFNKSYFKNLKRIKNNEHNIRT
jgi:hypothetical protein|tara:strand:- start:862 stop:1062 length:201 start_codon:yes stop_codon:yes gene_type:complete